MGVVVGQCGGGNSSVYTAALPRIHSRLASRMFASSSIYRLLNRRPARWAEVGSNRPHAADEDAQRPHDDSEICDDQRKA